MNPATSGSAAAPPVLGVRPLGPVTLAVHEAKKSERRVPGGLELMPRERRDAHEIVHPGLDDPVAHERARRAADDHHRVRVPVPLERRPPPAATSK